MLLRIDHETRLNYSEPVTESVITVRMAPPSGDEQTVHSYRLRTTPSASITNFRDGFGNRVDLFNVPQPHGEVVIVASSLVQTHRRPGPERIAGVGWSNEPPEDLEAMEYLRPSQLVADGPALTSFTTGLPRPDGPLIGVVNDLVAAVRGRLTYEKKVTTVNTPVAEALDLGRGVCQDFAHLLIAACRGIGLPARYVSGYVHHPGEIATHAWVQVWAGPSAGWVDVDPTHDDWPAEGHVVTAVGRDYADVPPNRGVWKGAAAEEIAVTVTVRQLDRLPPEAGEPAGAPAWVGMAPAPPAKSGRFQQQSQARVVRQQQSQQQQ
jgi:transglutaminase-like putative cysteine protease